MPWHVNENDSGCPTGKPYGVRQDNNNRLMGCHSSRQRANAQLAALYASENLGSDTSELADSSVNLRPTEEMAHNAERGLELRRKYGRGGTQIGVARARDIKNRKELSPSTVRRMVSYFARHEVDKKSPNWPTDKNGRHSNGYIAWLLWGGDSGRAWANARSNELDRRNK